MEGLYVGLLFTRTLLLLTLVYLGGVFWLGIRALHEKESGWTYQRAELIRSLEQQGGQHLVLVP